MRNYALNKGIPLEAIILEDNSYSTYENAVFTRSVMINQGFKSAIIVSSDYHMRRVKFLFDKFYKGTEISLIYSASKSSFFNPQIWWRNNKSVVSIIYEYCKLISNFFGIHSKDNNNKIPTKSRCLLTFDDGYDCIYTNAFSYMKSKGLKATLYAFTNAIEHNSTGYITKAHLNEMYANGWAIGNHTDTHENLTSLTHEQIKSRLLNARNWLIKNGYTRAADHIAYPFNAYNSDVLDVMAEIGAKTGRTTNAGFQYNAVKPYELHIRELYSTRTLDQAKAIIDEAITKQTTVIFVLHRIVETPSSSNEWSIANLQGLCDYLEQRQQDIKVETIDEWYKENVVEIADLTQ